MNYQVGYVWSDGKIITQSLGLIVRGTSGGQVTENQIDIVSKYVYEEGSNTPYAAMFSGSEYLFVKNAQGDVTAVVDSRNGETLAEYKYDPWGKVTLVNSDGETLDEVSMSLMGVICPVTYRGYNYDFTTGLYYLQSRYYNPEWGRFLNVDDVKILSTSAGDPLAANPYLYCNNNPVNRVDYTGLSSIEGPMYGVSLVVIMIISYNLIESKNLLYNNNIIDIEVNFAKDQTNVTLVITYMDNGKKVYQECHLQLRTLKDWYDLIYSNNYSPFEKTIDDLLFWSDWFPPGIENFTGFQIFDTVINIASPLADFVKSLTSKHHTSLEKYILREVEVFRSEGYLGAIVLFYIYQYKITKIGSTYFKVKETLIYPY